MRKYTLEYWCLTKDLDKQFNHFITYAKDAFSAVNNFKESKINHIGQPIIISIE